MCPQKNGISTTPQSTFSFYFFVTLAYCAAVCKRHNEHADYRVIGLLPHYLPRKGRTISRWQFAPVPMTQLSHTRSLHYQKQDENHLEWNATASSQRIVSRQLPDRIYYMENNNSQFMRHGATRKFLWKHKKILDLWYLYK